MGVEGQGGGGTGSLQPGWSCVSLPQLRASSLLAPVWLCTVPSSCHLATVPATLLLAQQLEVTCGCFRHRVRKIGAAATPWDLQIIGLGRGREEGVLICA